MTLPIRLIGASYHAVDRFAEKGKHPIRETSQRVQRAEAQQSRLAVATALRVKAPVGRRNAPSRTVALSAERVPRRGAAALWVCCKLHEDEEDDEDEDEEDESPQHSGALVTDAPRNCWLVWSHIVPDPDPDEDEDEEVPLGNLAQTQTTFSG